MPSDLSLFLGQLVRKPGQVVALAPSSSELAQAMAAPLRPGWRVAELGPGTGKITRAILRRRIPEDITMFELNPSFCERLAVEFPQATLHAASAAEVGLRCAPGLDAVVSGLPLLSMPPELQRAIVGGAFSVLRPGGLFIQFTYGPRPPVCGTVRRELGLVWDRSERIWANLPPARVYTFRRALT